MFESRFIIRFADDSVIVSLLEVHEVGRGPASDNFFKWCNESYIQLMSLKPKRCLLISSSVKWTAIRKKFIDGGS